MKLLILDVDGVLTDGTKVYNTNGDVIAKRFCDRDFTAIKEFKACGVEVIFLSGDTTVNKAVAESRCIPFYSSRNSKSNKLGKLEIAMDLIKDRKLTKSDVAFIGDDLFDVEMRKVSGLVACPSNSHTSMLQIADIVLKSASGENCIQELFDRFLANGILNARPTPEDVVLLDANEQVSY